MFIMNHPFVAFYALFTFFVKRLFLNRIFNLSYVNLFLLFFLFSKFLKEYKEFVSLPCVTSSYEINICQLYVIDTGKKNKQSFVKRCLKAGHAQAIRCYVDKVLVRKRFPADVLWKTRDPRTNNHEIGTNHELINKYLTYDVGILDVVKFLLAYQKPHRTITLHSNLCLQWDDEKQLMKQIKCSSLLFL